MLYAPDHHRHPKFFIWRFQTEDGYGPYAHPPSWEEVKKARDEGRDYISHPNPWDDAGLMGIDNFIMGDRQCGFHSIEQARQWFFGEQDMPRFENTGLQLCAWVRTPELEVCELRMQTMFKSPTYQAAMARINFRDLPRPVPVAKLSPELLWQENYDTLHDLAWYEILDQRAALMRKAA